MPDLFDDAVAMPLTQADRDEIDRDHLDALIFEAAQDAAFAAYHRERDEKHAAD